MREARRQCVLWAHLVSRAVYVAHGVLAGDGVVAVVVKAAVGRTPALGPELGGHELGP